MSSVSYIKSEESFDFSVIWPILQKIMNIRTQEELAQRLGIKTQAVSNAKKKNKFPLRWLHRLAQNNFLPWNEIPKLIPHEDGHPPARGSEGVILDAGKPEINTIKSSDNGMVLPQDIPIPYGPSGSQGLPKYRILIELLQRWVDSNFPPQQRPHLRAWIVDEDNMHPSIPRQAMLLIDQGDIDLHSMGIFAFRRSLNGHITIRRTFPHGDGVNIDLVNDNRAYPSTHVPAQTLTEGGGPLMVFGRVIYKGEKL